MFDGAHSTEYAPVSHVSAAAAAADPLQGTSAVAPFRWSPT